jgi:hypothetical protein
MTNLRKSDAPRDDGGFLVPAKFMEEIGLNFELPLPFPRTPRPRLTTWQRRRLWLRLLPYRTKWAIHNALFGEHERDEW